MRRSRFDVICSILLVLEVGPVKPTPLMAKANLSHLLFKKYIPELEKTKLIKKDTINSVVTYSLTDEGREYLREYRRFLKFSAGFGV